MKFSSKNTIKKNCTDLIVIVSLVKEKKEIFLFVCLFVCCIQIMKNVQVKPIQVKFSKQNIVVLKFS